MKNIPVDGRCNMLIDDRDEDLCRNIGSHVGCDVKLADDGRLYMVVSESSLDMRAGQYLHHIILGVSPDTVIIHQNGDTLDNRRLNLMEAKDGVTPGLVRFARLGFRSGLARDKQGRWYGWYEPNGERLTVRDPKNRRGRKFAAAALAEALIPYEPVRRERDGRGPINPKCKLVKNWYYTVSMHEKLKGYKDDESDKE